VILSRRWYISLLIGIRERCLYSSIREASILLNEASISEERCKVCFRSTEKEVQLAIPGRSYSQRILDLIMHACIILHDMIIDDERDGGYKALASLTTILQRETHLTSALMFLNLQSDLIEHVWNKFY
jgi:hypothetical protein